jgi:predicted Zn-dependent peptidase
LFEGTIKQNNRKGDFEIEKDMEQSYIYVTYDIDRLTFPQFIALYYILNSPVGICYQTLREKYGLVYGVSSNIRLFDNKMYINAQIDKNKKERFIKALDEIVADLNDPKKLKDLLCRAKEEHFSSEWTFDEESSNIVSSLSSYLLKTETADRNELNEGVRDLTTEELLQKTRSLKRKNIFMVRSEEDE